MSFNIFPSQFIFLFSFPDDGLIQQSDLREVMKACMEENGMKFDEKEIYFRQTSSTSKSSGLLFHPKLKWSSRALHAHTGVPGAEGCGVARQHKTISKLLSALAAGIGVLRLLYCNVCLRRGNVLPGTRTRINIL